MGKVIVIQFVTLDGVIQDPDGRGGTAFGGWGLRFGQEAIAGDLFRLGDVLDTCVALFGHRTWEQFAPLWLGRTDRFSTAMNRARKVVVSRGSVARETWANSERLDGELVESVGRIADDQDVVVIGSTSVVRELQAASRVDEYRLFTLPIAIGDPDAVRLFDAPVELRVVSVDATGPGTLTVLAVPGSS